MLFLSSTSTLSERVDSDQPKTRVLEVDDDVHRAARTVRTQTYASQLRALPPAMP